MDFFSQAYRGKTEWWRYVTYIVTSIVVAAIVQVILFVPLMILCNKNGIVMNPNELPFPIVMLCFAPFLFSFMLLAKPFLKRNAMSFMTARKSFSFRIFGWSALWFCVVLILDFVIGYLCDTENHIFNYTGADFWIFVIMAIILLPIQTGTEEFVVRGVIMQWLGVIFRNRIAAIVGSSVVFALLHFANEEVTDFGMPISMSIYLITGLSLGLIATVTDGIESSWGMHYANNLMAFTICSVEKRYNPLFVLDNVEVTWFSVVCSLIETVIVILLIKRFVPFSFSRLFDPVAKEGTSCMNKKIDVDPIRVRQYAKYLKQVPYNVLPQSLYTKEHLYDCFDLNNPSSSFEQCYDTIVYRHMVATGKIAPDAMETSARCMHDCMISNHMREFLNHYEERRVIGVMGGHAMLRSDDKYMQTARISKHLTEQGFLMISGGGPGAMEATHLGAWMAGRTDEELADAIAVLAEAPCFKDECWLAKSFEVMNRYPQVSNYESLAIPTWLYGHEPPAPFATRIAKFFNNSIREDTILTEAYGGIIYMPGGAGTLQEVFQEAVQNHYVSLGYPSPMIFVGRKHWTETTPVYPFMEQMIKTGQYRNLILDLVDTDDEIISAIMRFNKSAE